VKRNPASKGLQVDGASRARRGTQSTDVAMQYLRDIYEGLRTTGAALRTITKPFADRHDSGARGFAILGAMVRGIVQPGPLAAELSIGASLLTVELQRLSDARMITRDNDPDDARRVRLSLTDKGARLVQDTEHALFVAVAPILNEYTDAEKALVLKFLQRLSSVRPAENADPVVPERKRARRGKAAKRRTTR
jgi:MarR family transcriptional regulator, organic hydroperoxide resistance regulator